MQAKKDMPKRYHLNRPDLAQAVAVELRTCQDVKSQQRLLAARLAASGQLTAAQIAEQLGISRRRFFDWMNALKAGGLAGLLERQHGGGAVPQVQGDALKELQAGLQSGRWKRAKEIQHWLRERHTIRLKLAGVYYWLGKLGGVLKVPRKTHAQKDAAQAEKFQQTLCEQLANLNVAGGRPVRLWVADEHRYGLIPVVRKCWTLRGVRPTVPYRTKYEWSYLYSALEVDGENAAEFLCLPEVSLEMSGLFLEHLAASDPDAEHIVIWDQAGFHPKPELHAVPEHVHLVSLPPYSPELNPTEAIGDVIKDRIGNVLWEKLDDLEQAIGEELRPLYENAECVRRLVSHPWLVEQANATATENSAITCSKWCITRLPAGVLCKMYSFMRTSLLHVAMHQAARCRWIRQARCLPLHDHPSRVVATAGFPEPASTFNPEFPSFQLLGCSMLNVGCWMFSPCNCQGASLKRAAQAAFRQVRVQLLDAIRADAVGEGGIGVFLDVALHLAPIALVVADFFATGADGQQPAQGLHAGEGFLQVQDELVAFGLVLFPRGDVFLDGDVMGDAAREIADGRDGGAFPKKFAVLFFVVEFAAPFLSRRDGFPQFPVGFRAFLAGFQDARIFAQRLRQRVTGDFDELGIDVFNVTGGIGNDDRGGTLFHRPGQLAEFFLRPLALGDVADDRLEHRFAIQFHGAEQHLGGEGLAGVSPLMHPLEAVAALFQRRGDPLVGQRQGIRAVRLHRRRHIGGMFRAELLPGRAAEHRQGRRVAVEKALRVQQHHRVRVES